MRDYGFRFLARSPLVKFLQLIPLVRDFVEPVADVAELLDSNSGVRSKPLAYIGFAKTAFVPEDRYLPLQNMPLIPAMQSAS
ncbi:hypothetical protein ACLQ2Q_21355 [Microbacterium sp. DT81.1]|uniref:hypothetical protein n=1 Tax=Microbacterium sp. DT81.1 TaxID=3393413 RepID=UPI003CEA82A1